MQARSVTVNALVTRFLALLPSGQLPAPCFPVPEAGQRPDRTAVAALHAFGVDDTLHTLSLQQWVNAEGGGIENQPSQFNVSMRLPRRRCRTPSLRPAGA